MTTASRRPYVPVLGLAELSDEQLSEYVEYWTQRMEGFRAERAAMAKDHPRAFYTGYSGWWCSKYVSSGVFEQRRRDNAKRQGEGAK